MPPRAVAPIRCLATLLSLAPLTACSTRAPPQTAVMQSVGDIGLTARRIRIGATAMLQVYMSHIEVAADSISAATSDPRAHVNALVWKANAIPAFQRAMFQADPLVSLVDGWTLAVQMWEYFDTGAGRDLFGTEQAVAVTTARRLAMATDSAVRTKVSPAIYDLLRKAASDWAERHPLDNPLFLRRSIAETAADVLGAERLGGLSTLGSMAEMAEESRQMALVYATYLPKEVRWQSELLVASLMDSVRLHALLAAVERMEVVEEAARFLRETPELIASERAAGFRDIQAERLAALQELDRQRLATLQELMAWARAERVATLAGMARLVATEREAAFADVATITRGVVDHVFLRLVQVGAVLAGLVFVGLWRRSRGRARMPVQSGSRSGGA